ncbi:alpha/beta fold hydrolase [Planococcus alpniumensis]|uniref:alpha/beta fold hydrolase n=1 Tax=Planococcus alpniumensis TaxID=2708345 RepID=UPI001B8ADA2F|nr:alpha/beta fold hydrolase [Planococcus sp. MSAK28401]
MKKFKKSLVYLIVALLLVFIGSAVAAQFNSSSGEVDVSRIYFETERGELSGLLYKPDGADSEARPTLVATHGYLNSGEMQDAQAIEMSKRGYVVLALDQYDHGHSTGTMEKPVPFFSFWPQAMYDAVQYMYDQDYVLKDAEGNGIIAVSGHSMGGFSSTHAVMLDEVDFQDSGIRKIHSSLTMGSDYQWLKTLGYTGEEINASYGPRMSGKIAGVYDEFFFDAEASAAGQPVVKKDYVSTAEGLGFLGGLESAQAGEFYEVDGAQRIIYQPNETHPWNHFSQQSTAHAIDFYDAAFAEYGDLVAIGDDGQTWMWKEWFSFVALIGFFLLFIPVINLLTKLPFFNWVYTKRPAALSAPKTPGAKLAGYILLIVGALYPALFFTALYSGDATGMTLLRQISMITIGLAALIFIFSFVKNGDKSIKTGSGLILGIGIVQYIYLRQQERFFATTEWFGAATVNPVVFWAINVAIVTLMILVGYHFVAKKAEGASFASYGLKANAKTIVAALATAIVAVVIGYGLLYLVDALFKVDFRLWTLAVKTFEDQHVWALLRYAPLFFIYYFIVGLSVNVNTASSIYDGWKGYGISILHFIGGLVLYLAYHYGLLFLTGTGGYPAESLSSIIVIGLVPILLVAAIYNRYFFRKTGNVYVGAFLNTILMTLITLANTVLYTIL